MRKSIVAVLIVFAVGFTLAACSQQPTPPAEPAAPAEQRAEGSAMKPMEDVEAVTEEAAEAVEEAAEAVEEAAEAVEEEAGEMKEEASEALEGSAMKDMEGSEHK